ncbi:uncharacterized protein CTRU02_215165 [Colletotrichum truncatum]|uniref:Uncharacterized protein n=1 Tax=Colletotrichum truncatum TaxID=5467 RepID=A0ACC3YDU6_COLTU|nr:uncharacterized protein CTRU02_14221 [Colletotrichum truncatum]KAF6782444.1 hypothetical protein CTRU02_14221 [Colletotrichum truncatum]
MLTKIKTIRGISRDTDQTQRQCMKQYFDSSQSSIRVDLVMKPSFLELRRPTSKALGIGYCGGAPAPSLTEAKDFFRFYIESSKGRVTKNGKPTAESMVGIAEIFYRAFTCETQTETSEAQRTEVYHKLIRNDIELVQKRKPEGDGSFFFFRFVKNNRYVENQTFGITMHEHPVILHDIEALLEALIFADYALFALETLEDLWDLDIVPGDSENILRWNEEVLDLPLLRKIEGYGIVSREQMSLDVFQRAFRNILSLAGCIEVAAYVHQIRRHLGKKIDERYTEVYRSQNITQSDVMVFGASYVANCSSVDGLSAFLGENLDYTAVEFF